MLFVYAKWITRLFDFPGFPTIFNCRTSIEKVSKFFDHHFQPVMKAGTKGHKRLFVEA